MTSKFTGTSDTAPTGSQRSSFTETVRRGAFNKSLNDRLPVLMFNHGKHPQVGEMPIGMITTAREDERGLYIEARLFKNSLVEPVREAIAGGAISGMSFRFAVIRDSWSKDRSQRELLEVSVPELGPVVYPAYLDTVVGVRHEETTQNMTRAQ